MFTSTLFRDCCSRHHPVVWDDAGLDTDFDSCCLLLSLVSFHCCLLHPSPLPISLCSLSPSNPARSHFSHLSLGLPVHQNSTSSLRGHLLYTIYSSCPPHFTHISSTISPIQPLHSSPVLSIHPFTLNPFTLPLPPVLSSQSLLHSQPLHSSPVLSSHSFTLNPSTLPLSSLVTPSLSTPPLFPCPL